MCSLVYEFFVCDLMAVFSLEKVLSVEFRSLGGWVILSFFFPPKVASVKMCLLKIAGIRVHSLQITSKEELYSVFSMEVISFVEIR